MVCLELYETLLTSCMNFEKFIISLTIPEGGLELTRGQVGG